MVLAFAREINRLYYQDECQHFIIYGNPLGIGKSSYACQAVAEAYGIHAGVLEAPDYEMVKKRIVFHPREFLDISLNLRKRGRREKAIIWDDAGLWLYALDWYDPFVKAVGKFMNVARSVWAAIIFTSPSIDIIAKKVRQFEQGVNIKIIRSTARYNDRKKKPRLARAYRQWRAPDQKKTGVRKIWEDEFNAWLPNDFYEWYRPLRDQYSDMALDLMDKTLKQLLHKVEAIQVKITT